MRLRPGLNGNLQSQPRSQAIRLLGLIDRKRLRFVSVLPLARRWILINAGQLARRRILEDLVGGLEVPSSLAAVPPVPDEVAGDREDNHDNKDDKLHPEGQVALLSTIAAVP